MPIVSISINYASLSQLNTGTSTVLSIQPAALRSFFTQGAAAYGYSVKGATIRGTGTHAATLSITGNLTVGTTKFVVDASTARVGINNSSPTVSLDVIYSTNNVLFAINNTTSNRSSFIVQNSGLQIYTSTNSDTIRLTDSSSNTIATFLPITSPGISKVGIFRTPTTYSLEVQGTCTATNYVGDGGQLTGLLPIGTIIDFAGTTGQVPAGWIPCDGRAATGYPSLISLLTATGSPYGQSGGTPLVPDMRARTVVGAGAGSGLTSRSIGQTGGVETVLITSTQSALPNHNHTFSSQTTRSDNNRYQSPASIFSGLSLTSGSNSAENADTSHTNMQPYLSTTKIIRGQ